MAITRKDTIQLSVEINGKEVGKNLKDLEANYRKLRGEIKSMTVGQEDFNKKAKEIAEAKKELDKARKAAAGLNATAGIGSKVFKTLGNAIKTAFAPLLALSVIAELVGIAQEVWAVSQQFSDLRQNVNRLSGATGESLSKITAQAQALSNTFEVDVNKILEASRASATAWGEDFGEALNQIELGLLITGDKGDEFLEQVREYGPQFKQAGIEIEQGFALIAQGISLGAFNDKLPDALKEFNIRIKDISKGQRDLLEEVFGEQFAGSLVSRIEAQTITSAQALSEVSGKIEELGADSAAAQKIISNLFGGPGEDLGADFIISLQNIDKSMEDLIDTSNIYVKRQIEQLVLEKELAEAQEAVSAQLEASGVTWKKFTTFLKADFYTTINGIITSLRYLPERWQILKAQFVEGLNDMSRGLVNLFNKFQEFLGLEPSEFQPIILDKSSAELQAEMFNKMAEERKQFAAEQERQALAAAKKQGEAERLERARQAKILAGEELRRAQELEKMRREAELELQALQASLMQEGAEKRIAILRAEAEKRIAGLKGTAEQIQAQQRLLELKLAQDIAQVREDETGKEIKRLKDEAKKKIEALQGSSEEIKQAQAQIEAELSAGVKEAAQRGAEEQIKALEQAAQKRLELLSLDELRKAEKIRIEQELEAELARIQASDLEPEDKAAKLQQARDQADQLKELALSLKQDEIDQLLSLDEASLSEEQALRLQAAKALTNERLKVEQELAQDIANVNQQAQREIAINENEIQAQQLSSKQKAYEQELQAFSDMLAKKRAEAAAEAVEELAEDPRRKEQVEAQLKGKLLEAEEEFLQAKAQLMEKFGLSSEEAQEALENKRLEIIQAGAEREAQIREQGLKKFQDASAVVLGLSDAFGEISSAALEMQLSNLEKSKQRELKLAGNNEKAKQAIEEKYRAKKETAEKKAAKRSALISATQTVINTAQSIVKTGAELGYPAAIPFQIIAGLIGAAQLAKIKAQAFAEGGFSLEDGEAYYQGQRLQQRGSFADGGPVSRGSLGIIGERGPEWIAPNWMIESPQISPIIEDLEKVRLGRLSPQALELRPSLMLKPFAEGGFSAIPSNESILAAKASTDNEALITEIRALRAEVSKMKLVTVWGEREADLNNSIFSELQAKRAKSSI